jgi:hypothetical protein
MAITKQCLNCNESFEGNRKQLFCSEKCLHEYGTNDKSETQTKKNERLEVNNMEKLLSEVKKKTEEKQPPKENENRFYFEMRKKKLGF